MQNKHNTAQLVLRHLMQDQTLRVSCRKGPGASTFRYYFITGRPMNVKHKPSSVHPMLRKVRRTNPRSPKDTFRQEFMAHISYYGLGPSLLFPFRFDYEFTATIPVCPKYELELYVLYCSPTHPVLYQSALASVLVAHQLTNEPLSL